VIKRCGRIYNATWADPDGTQKTGTGLRTGDILSFAFLQLVWVYIKLFQMNASKGLGYGMVQIGLGKKSLT
jgi:hypothetical protein